MQGDARPRNDHQDGHRVISKPETYQSKQSCAHSKIRLKASKFPWKLKSVLALIAARLRFVLNGEQATIISLRLSPAVQVTTVSAFSGQLANKQLMKSLLQQQGNLAALSL
jgi:hypothetical protein